MPAPDILTADILASDALFSAEQWMAQGRRVALATVVTTWGSAPRQPGSTLAICDDGRFAGSVSSGCVEGAVIEAALAVLTNGKMRLLEFGVADDTAWSVGLTCGGKITILVEALHDAGEIAALNRYRRDAVAMVRIADITTGQTHLARPGDAIEGLGEALQAAARSDRSQLVDDRWFLGVFRPPVDLVLIGAVHIAQSLVPMAALLGHTVRVIDPRAAFATPERFPGVAVFTGFPDAVLARFPLRPHSALVTLAHDPKIDDPALIAALASPAFYVGALGSQKTQAARRERLMAQGFLQTDLARLHGPVGLAIGSKSPAEIALSILADITKTLRLA